MEFQDYYETLGIGRDASADEVKTAFRGLARKHHPDVNPGDPSAEGRFQAINEAYEVLRDPETRRKYDALGADWKQYEQAAAAGRDPFAGRGPFAGGWRPPAADGSAPFRDGPWHPLDAEGDRSPFGSSAFSEFFRTFFAGAPPAGRGRTVELPLELTLEEAFAGVTRRLATGTGDGRQVVEVRIPPGVADGSRVRVADRGAPGPAGPGDLLLRVRIAEHPVFTRRGRDLAMRCSMPLTTAVLGGEVDVPAVDGGTVRLKVPPGTARADVSDPGARHALAAAGRRPRQPVCDRACRAPAPTERGGAATFRGHRGVARERAKRPARSASAGGAFGGVRFP